MPLAHFHAKPSSLQGRNADILSVRRERGATLIEAAFATPVLLLLVFALADLALLSHDVVEASNVAQQGARAAAVYEARPEADFQVLQEVAKGGRLGTSDVDYVVVYRLRTVDDVMNPLCHATSVSSAADPDRPCNRYTAADFALNFYEPDGVTTTANFGCGTTAVDRHWCPADRETSLGGDIDIVGVYVSGTHRYVSGLVGRSRTIDGNAVAQLEPRDA